MQALDRFEPGPAAPASPDAEEVHVWLVPLDRPAAEVAELAGLLDPDEAARAERLRFDHHRRRYTVGRATLRRLLGRYLGREPAAIAFRYGATGKPYLADPGPARLELNLSHSGDLAVVALAAGRELGVDLERLRPMPEALAIAERFFSKAERRALAELPEAERDAAFFRCWTRKEAYLKAVGTGITVRLDAFDVTLGAGEPARVAAIDGDPLQGAAWRLLHLAPAPGWLGALALPAGDWRARGWRWR